MNDTKEYILVTSSLLFLRKSFKEVTLKEIVEKTGLSKGAFYHYFETKEKLFSEVLTYFLSLSNHNYGQFSRSSFNQFYCDYVSDTVRLNTAYINRFKLLSEKEVGFQFNFFSLMFDALKLFPDFKEQAIIGFNTEIKQWELAIQRGIDSGELKPDVSVKEMGQLFMHLSDGVGLHMIMRDYSMDVTVSRIKAQWDALYALIRQ